MNFIKDIVDMQDHCISAFQPGLQRIGQQIAISLHTCLPLKTS